MHRAAGNQPLASGAVAAPLPILQHHVSLLDAIEHASSLAGGWAAEGAALHGLLGQLHRRRAYDWTAPGHMLAMSFIHTLLLSAYLADLQQAQGLPVSAVGLTEGVASSPLRVVAPPVCQPGCLTLVPPAWTLTQAHPHRRQHAARQPPVAGQQVPGEPRCGCLDPPWLSCCWAGSG